MSHQLPATVPAIRWSQRRHLLCLRIDVHRAFDIQTMIEEGDDEKPVVVISCYGTPPTTSTTTTTTSQSTNTGGAASSASIVRNNNRGAVGDDNNVNEEDEEPTAFYQFKFEPHGLLTTDALDTCRAPTTTTDSYFRLHFPKRVQTNWVNFGVIIPASGAASDDDDDEHNNGTLSTATTTTHVVYDWDYCEGYLRNRYGNKTDNPAIENDDGIADPEDDNDNTKNKVEVVEVPKEEHAAVLVNSTEVLRPSPIRPSPPAVVVSTDGNIIDAKGETTTPILTTTTTTDIITSTTSTDTVPTIINNDDNAVTTTKDDHNDDDTSSNVSSLDSAEMEEDFANGLMEQMAEEQGMALTPEFYQSYLTKRIESKKQRKQDKIIANYLSGKECECDQKAVLERVTEFAKEMEEKGLLDEGGGEGASLRDNSRVYNEIVTASEKTAKGRAALTALVEQQQRAAAAATEANTTTTTQNGGDNVISSTHKDPETVEEALALLFPFSRWSRMIKKNGIAKSMQYTTITVVTFIANVVRWASGLGPVVEEVSLLDDVVVQCMIWSSVAIMLFGYFLTME